MRCGTSSLQFVIYFSALILLLFFRSIGTTPRFFIGSGDFRCYLVAGSTVLLRIQDHAAHRTHPALVVVIGFLCIYFINKYHTLYLQSGDKDQVAGGYGRSEMAVVTLFCLTYLAVFGFPPLHQQSAIPKEFGVDG